MKHLKVMLPMLAFVLAIGMSFAFTNAEEDAVVMGWYGPKGDRTAVQIDCEDGAFQCQIQLVDEANIPIGGPQFVYPTETSNSPLPSQSVLPYQIMEH